jgi:DNA-binding NarL/FixJ family response regulator
VLRLIAEGLTNRQIAERLGYRIGTVKDYVQRVIQKLEVSDRTQAAVRAMRLGLVD